MQRNDTTYKRYIRKMLNQRTVANKTKGQRSDIVMPSGEMVKPGATYLP